MILGEDSVRRSRSRIQAPSQGTAEQSSRLPSATRPAAALRTYSELQAHLHRKMQQSQLRSHRVSATEAKRPEAVSQRNPGSLRDSLDLPSLWLESAPCPLVSGPVRPCPAVEALVLFRGQLSS